MITPGGESVFDIGIVGGGVIGSSIAYELSRYNLKIAVFEKEPDVCFGTSGRNSGVLHAGFYYEPGSLKAKLCVEGNKIMREWVKLLRVPFKATGKVLVAFDEEEVEELHKLKERGEANGVEGLEIIRGSENVEKICPGIKGAIACMYSPATAIFSPYLLTIALAETAHYNGVKYFLNCEIKEVKKENGTFKLKDKNGNEYECRWLINAAGVHSADFSKIVGVNGYRIYPCRGEYLLLDKILAPLLKMPIYPVPAKKVGGHLGVHLTPTPEGPILVGPSAEYIEDPEDYESTPEVMNKLYEEGYKLWPYFKRSDVIRTFSGIRAKPVPPGDTRFFDFVIKEEETVPNFINLIGIESPGLTAAPAIAKMVKGIIEEKEKLTLKEDFEPRYLRGERFEEMSEEEKEKKAKEDPDWGEIICRCEKITRKEIIEAIENPLGAKTLASIKFRARAMMGRCQGGYCLPKIIEILEKEYGYKPEDFQLHKEGSWLFSGRMR